MKSHDYESTWGPFTDAEMQRPVQRLSALKEPPALRGQAARPSSPDNTHQGEHKAMQPNNGIIYAIIDTKADAIVGGLQLHRSDASAIRTFGDIASAPDTTVGKHPEDYELRRLGWITTENHIATRTDDDTYSDVIITGAQWLAAQNLGKDGAQ